MIFVSIISLSESDKTVTSAPGRDQKSFTRKTNVTFRGDRWKRKETKNYGRREKTQKRTNISH